MKRNIKNVKHILAEHDLVEGVEVKVNGKLVGELPGRMLHEFEELTEEEVEDFVLDNFDI